MSWSNTRASTNNPCAQEPASLKVGPVSPSSNCISSQEGCSRANRAAQKLALHPRSHPAEASLQAELAATTQPCRKRTFLSHGLPSAGLLHRPNFQCSSTICRPCTSGLYSLHHLQIGALATLGGPAAVPAHSVARPPAPSLHGQRGPVVSVPCSLRRTRSRFLLNKTWLVSGLHVFATQAIQAMLKGNKITIDYNEFIMRTRSTFPGQRHRTSSVCPCGWHEKRAFHYVFRASSCVSFLLKLHSGSAVRRREHMDDANILLCAVALKSPPGRALH